MNEENYAILQETLVSEGALRAERARNLRKAKTYRRRALVLTGRLAEEREYRRCAEHLAEATQAHAARVEQELMDTIRVKDDLAALLRRAYGELMSLDAKTRNELWRPDPELLNEIGNGVMETVRTPPAAHPLDWSGMVIAGDPTCEYDGIDSEISAYDPCAEEVAIMALRQFRPKPVNVYIPSLLALESRAASSSVHPDDSDDEEGLDDDDYDPAERDNDFPGW